MGEEAPQRCWEAAVEVQHHNCQPPRNATLTPCPPACPTPPIPSPLPPPQKGGYNAWYNVFDNKLKRRVYGEYAETYNHDGDSCGIHASGAGFARVDAIERIRLPGGGWGGVGCGVGDIQPRRLPGGGL